MTSTTRNSNNTKKIPLLNHNLMNSEALAEILRSKNSALPIHIVTATYLDPRRYHSFLYIWFYLIALFGAQFVQYSWVKSVWGKKWRSILEQWRERITMFEGKDGKVGGVAALLEWYGYKEDYSPESTLLFLKEFAQNMASSHDEDGDQSRVSNEDQQHDSDDDGATSLRPLAAMGASYVDPRLPNVVFLNHQENARQDAAQLDQADDHVEEANVINQGIDQVAKHMVHRLNHSMNSTMTYQEWEARNTPVWKSRFFIAPEQLPTMEQLDSEIDDEELFVAYNDPAPLPNEFQAYLFEDFLDDMQPEMDHRVMSHSQRVAYILRDVERDREQIIRTAIQKTKALSIK